MSSRSIIVLPDDSAKPILDAITFSDEGLIAELKKHDPNVEENLAITADKRQKHKH